MISHGRRRCPRFVSLCFNDRSSAKAQTTDWRGGGSGGMIIGDNYHRFPRFRLIDIGRNRSDIIDVKMTNFPNANCAYECNRGAIEKEYGITNEAEPREDGYKYKYLVDVDGNSFSGRYLGLLRSGSLVFKVRPSIGVVSMQTNSSISRPSSANTMTDGCDLMSTTYPFYRTFRISLRKLNGRLLTTPRLAEFRKQDVSLRRPY